MPAEIVLRCFRIELIEDEIWLAGEDTQICLRRRVPERALPTTDRAVAINSIIELGASLECDPTTVACALVGLGHLIRGLTWRCAARRARRPVMARRYGRVRHHRQVSRLHLANTCEQNRGEPGGQYDFNGNTYQDAWTCTLSFQFENAKTS